VEAAKRSFARAVDKVLGGVPSATDAFSGKTPGSTAGAVVDAALNGAAGTSMTGSLTIPTPFGASITATCCPEGQVALSGSPGLALAVTADVTYVKLGASPDYALGAYGGEGAYGGAAMIFQGVLQPVGWTASYGVGMGFKSTVPKVAEHISIPLTK